MSVMRPELIMKSIIPVVMAGIIAIYGLVVAVLIAGVLDDSSKYPLYKWVAHFYDFSPIHPSHVTIEKKSMITTHYTLTTRIRITTISTHQIPVQMTRAPWFGAESQEFRWNLEGKPHFN